MKNYLPLLFFVFLFSCEVFEPKAKEYKVSISAYYEDYSYYGPGNVQRYEYIDDGALIFVFNNIDASDGYLFDGKGYLFSTTKKIKYDQVLSIAEASATFSLKEGTYTIACISGNKKYSGKDPYLKDLMDFKYVTTKIDGSLDDHKFLFK